MTIYRQTFHDLYSTGSYTRAEKIQNIRRSRAVRKKLVESLSNKNLKEIELCHAGLMEFLGRDKSTPVMKRYLELIGHDDGEGKSKELFLTRKQTLRMSKNPVRFFSTREALILGINILFHSSKSGMVEEDSRKEPEDMPLNKSLAKKFVAHALNTPEGKDENKALSNVVLGLQHFSQGVEKERHLAPERKRNLKKAKTFFVQAMELGMASDLVVITLGVIEGLLGRFEQALHFLFSAVRIARKKVFIYNLMAKIYELMGMGRVSTFYRNKVEQIEGRVKEEVEEFAGAKVLPFRQKKKEEAYELFTFAAA